MVSKGTLLTRLRSLCSKKIANLDMSLFHGIQRARLQATSAAECCL